MVSDHFQSDLGARYLTGENIKVVQAEFSALSLAVNVGSAW